MILACQNIKKAFGEKEILKKVNFHLEEKEKAAIVGINGAGKTTLLRIILGELPADEGNIVISKDTTIGYLSQHQDIAFEKSVYEEMLEVKRYIIEMEEEIRRLQEEMQHLSGHALDEVMDRYHVLTSQYDRENGYAYKSEITGVLKGLGFQEADYDRPVNSLSGGEKMRVALGRLLLSRPELIILDEPTNHLDLPSVSWLENFLASYRGSVVIVSHDRYFIDKIATKIIEIDQGVSTVFNGNYTFYSKQRAKIREDKMKAYLNQAREIRHQEEVIEKLKSFNREKSIKRAESREKMLERIDVLEKPTEVNADMRLTLTPITESGQDVLFCDGLTKSFSGNTLFENLTIDIKRGEHVALIGGNGTGKTTILKIINHMLQPDKGSVRLGSRVHIGYFDQEHRTLSPDKTIFEEISDTFPDLGNTRIRNVLAAFLFTGDDVFQKIQDLSGGEQSRVALAKLMLSPANLLILDEPTNHLDIQSKEILEQALSSYTGTLLYVSHDRYFINRTANRILELRNCTLTGYVGDYEYYETHREEVWQRNDTGASAAAPSADTGTKDAYLKNKAEQARLRKIENDMKKIESSIEETEEQIAALDAEINLPENATDPAKLMELSEKREQLSSLLEELYEKWEALSES